VPLKLVSHVVVGDQVLTFVFLAGAFVLESMLLIRLWQRFFPDLPSWTVMGGMLVAGLVNPVPWLLFSPRIYEAAIAAGQFFFVGGLYAALCALDGENACAWRLSVAALLWACAVASRATVAVAVSFLALAVVLELLLRPGVLLGSRVRTVAGFAAPLAVGAILVAIYNQVRFGSIFEFGFRYAITMLDQNKYHDILFSPRYLSENAWLYFLNPPTLDRLFPFIRPVWNEASIMAFDRRIGGIYNAERIIGLIYAAPFLLCGLLAPVLALWPASRRPSNLDEAGQATIRVEANPFLRRLVAVLAGLAGVELAVVFLVYYATMRYFLDAVPTLVILAVLGFWLGLRRLGAGGLRLAFAALGAALMLSTILVGVLVGFYSDVPRLREANPWLLAHLRIFFSTLPHRLGL
jgi:hypothetical protein